MYSYIKKVVNRMILADRKYLAVPLPEDIEKRKMHGDFNEALQLIKEKMEKNIPISLRKRLEIEEEIIATLRQAYPYTLPEALKITNEKIPDFTMEDLNQLVNENVLDWYYIDGEIHLIDSFFDNLVKVNHPAINRSSAKADDTEFNQSQKRLNDSMALMKKEGGSAYRYKIRASLKILPEKAQVGKQVLVHLPIPAQVLQTKNIQILSHTDCECFVAPEHHPTRTIAFSCPLEKENEFFVEYSFENHTPYVLLDPEKASAKQPDFRTNEQAPHILFTPFIKELYEEIVGDEQNPVIKARKIYDYITQNIKYSFMRPYSAINNIPEYAAANGKGDCGVQALLFITLCRYGKIPARWQSGLYLTKDDPGSHDWAQFYVEPYGWVFADLSFGGSSFRVGNEERRQFYFGNLDPFRMPANSVFSHEFFIHKKFTRYDPTDNQVGEAEYEDGPVPREDYVCTQTVLEMEPIPFEK